MQQNKISKPCSGKNKNLSIYNVCCLTERCAQQELVNVPGIIPMFKRLLHGNSCLDSPLVELFASRRTTRSLAVSPDVAIRNQANR